MTKIEYTKGDATAPAGDGPQIIAHVCNDIGGWGRGFVLALSRKWKGPEDAYRQWFREQSPPFALGEIQIIEVADGLSVANMIGQRDIHAGPEGPPIRYDAIESCLSNLARVAKEQGASVHMPRIGCGLAGGTWDEIEPLIAATLLKEDIPVTVYDLP